MIAIKAFQVLLGPIYDFLDGRLLGHSLRKSEAARIKLREEQEARGEEFKGWEVKRWVFWLFGGQLGAMILVSWVVSYVRKREWSFADLIDIPCLHNWFKAKIKRERSYY